MDRDGQLTAQPAKVNRPERSKFGVATNWTTKVFVAFRAAAISIDYSTVYRVRGLFCKNGPLSIVISLPTPLLEPVIRRREETADHEARS